MAFEEEYNMLDKRIHLQDTITVSLEFLGFVEPLGELAILTV